MCVTPRSARTTQRRRLCTSLWVGPRPASAAGTAPCAASGSWASLSSGPRPPAASLPPSVPSRLPAAISGLFKNASPAQSPSDLGVPGTSWPGWLPLASPRTGQAAPVREVSQLARRPARCSLPSRSSARRRARVPRCLPRPFHVLSTVPCVSSVMTVPETRKPPVLLATGSERSGCRWAQTCPGPLPAPRPRRCSSHSARHGTCDRADSARGLVFTMPRARLRRQAPSSPAVTPRELHGRDHAPFPQNSFPRPFWKCVTCQSHDSRTPESRPQLPCLAYCWAPCGDGVWASRKEAGSPPGLLSTGDSLAMDVSSVHHGGTLLRYWVSLLGYGFYGDIIRDSEKKRWMGLIRYDFSGKSAVRGERCVHTARLTAPAGRLREASSHHRGCGPGAL